MQYVYWLFAVWFIGSWLVWLCTCLGALIYSFLKLKRIDGDFLMLPILPVIIAIGIVVTSIQYLKGIEKC